MNEDIRQAISELLEEIKRTPDQKTFDELVRLFDEHKPGCGKSAAARLFRIAGVNDDGFMH